MQTQTEHVETEFLGLPVPEAQDMARLEALIQERSARPTVLPESSVSAFPFPKVTVCVTLHSLDLSAARDAVATSLAQTHPQRLTGIRADRAAESLCPVFLPRWWLKGEISGRWQADGIESENWEVDCPHCFGSGKVGIGVQQRECSSCWGGGKEKQTRKHRHPHEGRDETTLQESVANEGAGGAWSVDAAWAKEKPLLFLLPEAFRGRLSCLRPAGVYPSVVLDAFKNRLACALEDQAKKTLTQYSRVENFRFDPSSIRSQSAAVAWLYPAYLAAVSGKEGKHYVLCDALTGKVLVQSATAIGEVAEDEGGRSRLLVRALGVAAGVAAAAAVALWYFYGRG